MNPVVEAAGAVVWRPSAQHAGRVEVAVVHRPRYDDWSLPKGKRDPGEHLVTCAVREVAEETGITGALGPRLGVLRYDVPDPAAGPNSGVAVTKEVTYWSLQAERGRAGVEFTPNDEVDELRWLSVEAAAQCLSREGDRAPLQWFAELPPALTGVILLRHAHAGSRRAWQGLDESRPLDARGASQAAAVARVLPAFAPQHLASAPVARCHQTIAPLAHALALPIDVLAELGEEAHAEDPARTTNTVCALATRPGVTVACSQGGAIPDVVAELTAHLPVGDVRAAKGSAWLLWFHEGAVVAADYLDSLLAS